MAQNERITPNLNIPLPPDNSANTPWGKDLELLSQGFETIDAGGDAALPTGSGNKVIATPANGSSGVSALRALVAADVPATPLPTGSGNKVVATPADGSSGVSTLRVLAAADLPKATSSAFGAVQPDNATLDVAGAGGTLEMKPVAGVAGTYTAITSITIDGFGRVTAITGT